MTRAQHAAVTAAQMAARATTGIRSFRAAPTHAAAPPKPMAPGIALRLPSQCTG